MIACSVALVSLVFGPTTAIAENCTTSMTVDNAYNAHFVDSLLSSPTPVGGDNNGSTTETWNISGVAATDYRYVATASDYSAAQGFVGEFTNLTICRSFTTSAASNTPWEVFPAGQYLAQLHAIDASFPTTAWPASVQPTLSRVQTASAYAETNDLWVSSDSAPGYTHGAVPWNPRPGIPANAESIWHNGGPGPFSSINPLPLGGGSHNEFLLFQVVGAAVPELASLVLLP